MRIFKKVMNVFICLSISLYGLPAFASISAETDASKVVLSEADMKAAVGGALHAEILTRGAYEDDRVSALVAITGGFNGNDYSFEAINIDGNVVRVIESGTLGGNEAKVLTGFRQPGEGSYRVWIKNSSYPAIEAKDTEFEIVF